MQQWDRKVVLLKAETVYGTDSVPTGAANAILALNGTLDPNPQTVLNRQLMRPYLGNAQKPTAARHVALSFDIEMAGTGIAPPSTAPKYGPALRAAGLAETVDATPASERVEYDPVSEGYESASAYFNMDGVEHQLLGMRGNVQLVVPKGEVPLFRLNYLALHVPPTEVALPTADFAGFRLPRPIEDANTPTFALDGFAAMFHSMTLNIAQRLVHRNLVNGESIDITGREPTGTVQIEAPSLATKDFFAIAEAQRQPGAALSALQLVHGTASGDIVQIDCPAVQLINPRYVQEDGVAYLEMDLNPTAVAGDDELKVTVK